MFGWAASDIQGQPVSVLITDRDGRANPGDKAHAWAMGASDAFGGSREVTAQRRDGSLFPARLALGHTKLTDGKELFVGFITDITEQKAREQDIIDERNRANLAAGAKSSFIANVSHEIRTPMNAIIGFSQLLLEEPQLTPEAKQFARRILGSSNSLLHLVNDILDSAKLENGTFLLELVPFNLPDLLREAAQTVEMMAVLKLLEFHVDLADDLPMQVKGDPDSVRKIVLNLLSNAIKFTESGSVTLRVAALPERESIQIQVIDTGIGMTEQQSAEVFEPFVQADGSTRRLFGGTGLGMSIARHLCQQMQGHIQVQSEVEKGTCFTAVIRLPITHDRPVSRPSEDPTGLSSERAFNILVVEDVEINAELVAMRLGALGHSVTWARSGKQAIRLYERQDFDLILMDIMMPEMDGIEATQRIRATDKDRTDPVPIIALTASAMTESFPEYLAAGMNYVVVKPIDFKKLVETMEAAVASEPSAASEVAVVDATEQLIDWAMAIDLWSDLAFVKQAIRGFLNEYIFVGEEVSAMLFDALPEDRELFEPFMNDMLAQANELSLGGVRQACAQLIELVADGGGSRATLERAIDYLVGVLVITKKELMAPSVEFMETDSPSRTAPAPVAQRILLVSASLPTQRIVRSAFKDLDFHISVERSSLVALQRLKNQAFSAVLMDTELAVIDGIRAAQYLRSDPAHLDPNVALVGILGDVSLRGQADAMDATVVRPIEPANCRPRF